MISLPLMENIPLLMAAVVYQRISLVRSGALLERVEILMISLMHIKYVSRDLKA